MDELIPLDLAPPSKLYGMEPGPNLNPHDLAAPKRAMTPSFFPRGYVPSRYAPGPLADGMARVVLGEDYYQGAEWSDYDPRESSQRPDDVFDVPQEQRDRWEAAEEAYRAAQEEIGALIEQRQRV